MIADNLVNQLKSNFRGKILLPGETGYEESRLVYNGMISRRPWIIAKCADVTDVITSINFGRDNKIPLSILGGGHNAGGLGVCDFGIAIQLTGLKYTHVDPKAETVRVGGGSVWGDVDHATTPFGYAVPSGIISTTGVGGLTLGGGIGHLSRKYGLTIDNIVEADVVLADGTLVKASQKENPDLFWGIRGGGGNFGVVTSFLFKMRKLNYVYAGPMLWELERTEEVLKWYDEFIAKAPTDLNGFFAFLSVPPGDPFPKEIHNKLMCGVVWHYSGPESKVEDVFKPIRKMKPAYEFTGNLPHHVVQSMFDALYPAGHQWYWKADFVSEIPDEAIKVHAKFGKLLPTPLSTMHLYPINGVVHKVRENETAFAYRDAKYAMVIVGVDPDPAKKDFITKWAKDYHTAIHPYSATGAYINFMMHDEGQERIKASYRGNYDRLLEVKRKYDPKNVFSINQNINPGVGELKPQEVHTQS